MYAKRARLPIRTVLRTQGLLTEVARCLQGRTNPLACSVRLVSTRTRKSPLADVARCLQGVQGSEPRPPRGSSIVGGTCGNPRVSRRTAPPACGAGTARVLPLTCGLDAVAARALPPDCDLDAPGGLLARKPADIATLFAIGTHRTLRARKPAESVTLFSIGTRTPAGKPPAERRAGTVLRVSPGRALPSNGSPEERSPQKARLASLSSKASRNRGASAHGARAGRRRGPGPAAAGGEAAAGNVGARPGVRKRDSPFFTFLFHVRRDGA